MEGAKPERGKKKLEQLDLISERNTKSNRYSSLSIWPRFFERPENVKRERARSERTRTTQRVERKKQRKVKSSRVKRN